MKKYIGAGSEYNSFEKFVEAPLMRKIFYIDDALEKTFIKIGTPGFYELYINGHQITKGFLAPYISNPDDYIYYDVYDITDYLVQGENCIGIILGNGLMNNPGGHVWNFDQASWRGPVRVAFEIYNDRKMICQSDESVKTHSSAIYFDDFRSGEYYDARNELQGWNLVDFSDEEWEHAIELPAMAGEEKICTADPIKKRKELKPVSISSYDGGYLYDFGENASGVCKIHIENSYEGQKIIIRHGEHIKDGKLNLDNIGFSNSTSFQNSFIQKSIYICSGKEVEEHIPKFVYNGFRYAYVTGVTKEQADESLLTYIQFNSDLKKTGDFSCSDETINAIQKIALNSVESCFMYYPVDCPQREKNGWTADAALSAEYTLLNFDAGRNYIEWLHNIRKAQRETGILPGIIPTYEWGYGHGPAWDGIIVTVPYDVYRYTSNIQILTQNAEAIFKYLGYLKSITDENGIIDFGHGDWCDINDPVPGGLNFSSPKKVTSTILAMYQHKCAADIFDVIHDKQKSEYAFQAYQRYRNAIRHHLIDFSSMTVVGNCETSQAMALWYGVFDKEEEKKAAEALVNIIKEKDCFINCGVLGNKVLYNTLSKFGYGNIAYKMITRPEAPSFGNLVKTGATTLHEQFSSEEQQKKYGVASLNHHFWGSVTVWFYSCITGIKYNPYFKDSNYAEILPDFIDGINSAKAHIYTKYGRLSVEWMKMDKHTVKMKIEKPVEINADFIAPEGWKCKDGAVSEKLEGHIVNLILNMR